MSDDKVQILKMLEENKITAEEAQRLLSASKPQTKASESNFSMKNLDGFINSMGRKMGKLKDKAVPMINDVVEVVKEKSADCIEVISASLNSDTSEGGNTKPSHFKEVDLQVDKGADICFIAKKGNINLIGYNGNKVSGKVYFKSRNSSCDIDIVNEADKICTKFDDDNFDSIFIDVIIPFDFFNKIELYNIKGNIVVENLKCSDFKAENEGGKIAIKNVTSKIGSIENNNSNLFIDYSDTDNDTKQDWNIEVNNGSAEINAGEKKKAFICAEAILGKVDFSNSLYDVIAGTNSDLKLKSKAENTALSELNINVTVSNENIIIK